MKCSVLICGALITVLGFHVENSSQLSFWRCPSVQITNGRARLRAHGRILRFNCNRGFLIVGNKYATCTRGRWDNLPPICASTQCLPVSDPENGRVEKKYNGAVAMVFCEAGYQRQGPSEIYCTGRTWNDTVPTCQNNRTNPPTSCNFEDPDLCLWEQDPLHDFDWKRHNFDTPSWHIGTGPSHDHTLGPGYNGYYLYIEASGKLENSTASIISPLYSSNLTKEGCFSFWYHMYGNTIGTLNVYFKAEGETDRRLMFTQSGNKGDLWRHGFFDLPKENSSFQIIVEGVRGAGYLSDIAVDDVAILQGPDCPSSLNATTEMIPTDGYDQVEIVNGMQTCRGRCTESNSTDDSTSLCQCNSYCAENHNCCPDYVAYCIFAITDDTTDFTSDDSDVTTLPPMRPKIPTTAGPERVPIPINPKDDIDPNPPKIPEKSNNSSTAIVPPREGPKISTRKTVVTTSKPAASYVPPRIPVTLSTVPTVAKITTNDDNFDNQIGTHATAEKNQSSNRDRGKVTLSGIIAIVFGAMVGLAGMALIVFLVLHKRNSYKNGSGKSALSDDSDVRFLTSDEMLDFNLAKPEDMEIM